MPCLLLSNRGLVKTRKFAKPVYVGDPINAIRIFNDKEVDEIVVLDIDASRLHREPDYETIGAFASECFMPLCYGGGITTVDQARRLFSLGVEKVSLQTSALRDLSLVSEIADRYGNQSVVVSIDVANTLFGRRRLHSSAGLSPKQEWREFLQAAVRAGAGEILLTSVEVEGTMKGVDTALIAEAAAVCGVPLIASGGVGSLDDIKRAVMAGANAVAVGAFFVFHGPHRAVLITYPNYDELVVLLNA